MTLLAFPICAIQVGPRCRWSGTPALTETMLEHRMANHRYATEEWRAIAGYSDYEVSSRGRVRRLWADGTLRREVALSSDRAGYQIVTLFRDSGPKMMKVHRLVCATFNGPQPDNERRFVAHWDGNPKNNAPDNLRWASAKENIADKRRHGTHLQGAAHPQATLTEAQVRQIRSLPPGRLPKGHMKRLVAQYGVDESSIANVRARRTWTQVP